MTLHPKTLLTRAFLLITTLILLSLATVVWVFQQASEAPRAQQKAQLVVSTINLTRAAILSAAPQWRGALLAELRAAEGMRVEIAETSDVMIPLDIDSHELSLMVQQVRNKLGSDTQFASMRHGIEDLWVSFHLGADEFWVAIPRTRVDQPISRMLILFSAVILLFALLGAYLIARQVSLPLKRLSLAAQQIGQGKTDIALTENGTQEIMMVSQAFNQMSADLNRNERERALVLAGISHDLRTPLTRIRLSAEMSNDEFLRDEINADVTQMDAIIQQFLDYARLDTQEVAEQCDITALIHEVTQPYLTRAHSLVFDLQNLPPQNVRPLILKRALANLLENALKYGGGDIEVGLHQSAHQFSISVSDRGMGIPTEQLEAAKRPFVRLESARSDASGSGLGLAIVERAAQAHQGNFALTQRNGGGLTATLTFPLLS